MPASTVWPILGYLSCRRKMKLFKMNLGLKLLILCIIVCSSVSGYCSGSLSPGDITLHNRAMALMGQFDFEHAYTLFAELAEAHPDNDELMINQAIALLNRQREGDENSALAILGSVLGRDSTNTRAMYCSGILELHRGNLEKALAFFESVLENDDSDPDVLYFTGKTLMQLSRYDEAQVLFERSLAKDQYVSSSYYGLIMIMRHLGRKQEAVSLINDYRRFKDNPRARIVEFKYSKMGRLAEVRALGSDLPPSFQKPAAPLFAPPSALSLSMDFPWIDPSSDRIQEASGLTVCDINQDGYLDLFIPGAGMETSGAVNAVLMGTGLAGRFSPDLNHPLARVTGVNAVLWGDINDDGLVDAYLCRRGSNQLWMQASGGTWADVTESSGTGQGGGDTVSGALFDADHDGDLDIFVVNTDGPNELLNNNRDGTFRPLAADYGLTGNGTPSRSVVVRDLDNDRDADIIIINQSPPHEIYLNEKLWNYRKAPGFESLAAADITAMVAGDLDTDGSVELYTVDAKGVLFRWSPGEDGIWQPSPLEMAGGSAEEKEENKRLLALADVDGDGHVDLFTSDKNRWQVFSVKGLQLTRMYMDQALQGGEDRLLSTAAGPAVVRYCRGRVPELWAPGKGRYPFSLVSVSGRKDPDASLRSNASGIGTRVSVRIGSGWTVVDTFPAISGAGQDFQPLCIGTAGADQIDFVSLDWSDGVFQTEISLDASTRHELIETQRQLSSCPVVFAWNGHRREFVSDILGVGGIGYAVGPGVYAESRPWENFLFPEDALAPRNGKLELTMMEPMEEVEYLDHASMAVYDLPPGWSMTLDERMGISGPQPTGRPVFYQTLVLPERAVNDRGEDVIDRIRTVDLKAAPVGQVDQRFVGMLRREHSVSLYFDQALVPASGRPVLLADGWIEYPYSQTSFAAWQAGAEYRAPSIDYKDRDGQWILLMDQAGYPAGMPRQMSLPLDGLPNDVHELRIRTNQEIYWDRICVVYEQHCPGVLIREVPAQRASLEFVGFPQRNDFPQRRPYYDFARRDLNWASRVLEGDYTRFGPVEELIAQQDDAVVVIGPGEGVDLEFEAPGQQVADGWTRRYVLRARGWCKDMDLFTDTGDTVGPLPALNPDNPVADDLHGRYNIRYLTGRR